MKRRKFVSAVAILIAGLANKSSRGQQVNLRRINDTLYIIRDKFTGENFSYSKVTQFTDGSIMDDTKVDGVIYRKFSGGYFKRIFKGPINVKWFGAKGDSKTDDTQSIRRCAAAINANRTGDIFFPKGIYRVFSLEFSGPLIALNGVNNFRIIGGDSKIKSDRIFSGVQRQEIISLTNCKNLTLELPELIGIPAVSGLSGVYGLDGISLYGNCENVNIPSLKLTGLRVGLAAYATSGAAENAKTKGITIGTMLANNCGYPLNFQFSGNDVVIRFLETSGSHRSYFAYGVKNHNVNIESRNQDADDVLLNSYEGKGLENIKLSYTNIHSSSAQAAASCVAIVAGDQTPATIKNITIHLKIHYPAYGYPGHAICVKKYNNQGFYDLVDRGHIFENITVSGLVTAASPVIPPIAFYGYWGLGETIRNFTFRYLTLKGTASATINFGAAKGRCGLRNVISDANVYIVGAPEAAEVSVIDCEAPNFTGSVTEAGFVSYINCNITDGSLQSFRNKTFLKSKIAGKAKSTK